MNIVSPSILSADFNNLEYDVRKIMSAGAEWIHFDVMDGHFVPNLSFGIPVLKALRKIPEAFLDVHLMISQPENLIDAFCDSGADLVTVHYEASSEENIAWCLKRIREKGKKSGISLKPGTSAEVLRKFEGLYDLVLIMTVEPGFGGQKFMSDMVSKIAQVKSLNSDCYVEVDGGINAETVKLCSEAGANVIVAGSYVFGNSDYKAAIESLR